MKITIDTAYQDKDQPKEFPVITVEGTEYDSPEAVAKAYKEARKELRKEDK